MAPEQIPYGFSNIATGQLAVTTEAQQLPDASGSKIILTALKANTIPVYIGGAGVTDETGLELEPGVPVELNTANLNKLYVIASATGASVSWAALY